MNGQWGVRAGRIWRRLCRTYASNERLVDQLFRVRSETIPTSSLWDQARQPIRPLSLIRYGPGISDNRSDDRLVKLGRSFKQLMDARQQLTSDDITLKLDRSQYHQLGLSVLEKTAETNDLLDQYTATTRSDNRHIRNLNQIATSELVPDESILAGVSDDKYELPRISTVTDFHPLLLSDIDHIGQFCRAIGAEYEASDDELASSLSKIYNYGKASVTFYLQLYDLPKSLLTDIIPKVIKSSLIQRSFLEPKVQRYVKALIDKDPAYSQKLFYQYMGLLACTQEFPIKWLQELLTNQRDDLELKEATEFPQIKACFPNGVSVPDPVPQEWIKLGSETLVNTLLSFTDEPNNLRTHAEVIFNALDAQNDTSMDTPSLLSSLVLQDFGKFECMIRDFFVKCPSVVPQKTKDLIKEYVYKYNIPLPVLTNNDVFAVEKSICNRFLTINSVILRPPGPSWYNRDDIKALLWKYNDLGVSKYSRIVDLFVAKHSDRYYIDKLRKLVNSNEFKRHLLESSGYFANQPQDSPLTTRLVKYRHMNSLVSTQFHQMFSLLCPQHQHKLATETFTRLTAVLDNSNNEEVDEFFTTIYRDLNSREFSLVHINKGRVLRRLNTDIQLIGHDANDITCGTGTRRLAHYAMINNLNCGLSTFISSVNEVKDILRTAFGTALDKSVGTKEVSGISTEKEIGALLVQIDGHRPFNPHTIGRIKVDIIEEAYSTELVGNYELAPLPALEANNNLHKLLLVNYYHARTFLNAIDSNMSNQNRLPDLITMYGSVGSNYYDYLVYKTLASSDIPHEECKRYIRCFQDKRFKAQFVKHLTHPFTCPNKARNTRVQKLCTELKDKYSVNEYYRLRYYNQIFNQYIGAITSIADPWFEQVAREVLEKGVDQFEDEIQHLQT